MTDEQRREKDRLVEEKLRPYESCGIQYVHSDTVSSFVSRDKCLVLDIPPEQEDLWWEDIPGVIEAITQRKMYRGIMPQFKIFLIVQTLTNEQQAKFQEIITQKVVDYIEKKDKTFKGTKLVINMKDLAKEKFWPEITSHGLFKLLESK